MYSSIKSILKKFVIECVYRSYVNKGAGENWNERIRARELELENKTRKLKKKKQDPQIVYIVFL